MKKQKSKMIAAVLSLFWGWFGIDRFYLGYTWRGILKLLVSMTMWIFAYNNIALFPILYLLWLAVDFILICTGRLKPADGSDYASKQQTPVSSSSERISLSQGDESSGGAFWADHSKEVSQSIHYINEFLSSLEVGDILLLSVLFDYEGYQLKQLDRKALWDRIIDPNDKSNRFPRIFYRVVKICPGQYEKKENQIEITEKPCLYAERIAAKAENGLGWDKKIETIEMVQYEEFGWTEGHSKVSFKRPYSKFIHYQEFRASGFSVMVCNFPFKLNDEEKEDLFSRLNKLKKPAETEKRISLSQGDESSGCPFWADHSSEVSQSIHYINKFLSSLEVGDILLKSFLFNYEGYQLKQLERTALWNRIIDPNDKSNRFPRIFYRVVKICPGQYEKKENQIEITEKPCLYAERIAAKVENGLGWFKKIEITEMVHYDEFGWTEERWDVPFKRPNSAFIYYQEFPASGFPVMVSDFPFKLNDEEKEDLFARLNKVNKTAERESQPDHAAESGVH